MKNNHDENEGATSEHVEELTSIDESCEHIPIDAPSVNEINEYINDNTDCQACVISIINNSQRSLWNSTEQSYDDPRVVSFDPKDWLMSNEISGKHRAPRQNEFLCLLLENSRYSSYISWFNKDEGTFKIHEPERVATLWAKVKNRQTNRLMDYETFARAIRHYYKSGMMIKTHRKYTFRFNISKNK